MMYKVCAYCQSTYPYNEKCECFKNRVIAENKVRHKLYDEKRNQEYKRFYSSVEWQKARERALETCNYLDLYSLYVLGKIEHADVVHHIVELEECYDKRLDQSNLIGLTNVNHRLIHKEYKTNKIQTQRLLLDILAEHKG